MFVGFSVVVQGEQQVDFAFVRMQEGLGDLREPLGQVGDHIIDAVRDQFETQGLRAGARWTRLSDAYRRWKERRYPGRKILVREGGSKGAALNKLQALRVTSRRVVYEPPGRAADILGRHQAGDPDRNLPQRKVVDLTPGRDRRAFERIFAQWIRHLDGRASWPPT